MQGCIDFINSKLELVDMGQAEHLQIGGFVPHSTTAYPKQVSAVVLCQGCPWHCGYCENPHLVAKCGTTAASWERVVAFLHERRGTLDAVVFSGGEPTMQAAILPAISEVKALGYKVGLETAGIYPRVLRAALPLVDWVGLDIKAPYEDYERITGVRHSGKRVKESAVAILDSGVDHEFRTTVDEAQLNAREVLQISHQLSALGGKRYALQSCRPSSGHSHKLRVENQRHSFMHELQPWLEQRFEDFAVRSD